MSLKAGLTPIEELTELPVDARSKLRGLSVTTIEEFVGVAQTNRSKLCEFLGLSPTQFDGIVCAAEERLPQATLGAMRAPRPRYRLGALDPRTRRR